MTNYEQIAQELDEFQRQQRVTLRAMRSDTGDVFERAAAAIRELCKSNKAKDAQIAELQAKLDAAKKAFRDMDNIPHMHVDSLFTESVKEWRDTALAALEEK